MNEDEKSIV